MPASGSALGRAVPTPYALPADALEGLLRLASHVALTEAAVAFLRDDDHVWVLASSGVTAGAAHAAALLLPDVLQDDADELLCLDLAAAGDPLSLMGTALVDTPGFLYLVRFTVEEPRCEGVLCVAHPVARNQIAAETRMLVQELARQIALRLEARTQKRKLDAAAEWRANVDQYLSTLGNNNSLGQCVVDSHGLVLSASHGLLSALKLRDADLRGSNFERVFAFDAAFQDAHGEHRGGAIPWDRMQSTALFFRSEDGELHHFLSSAVPVAHPEATPAWCISIARADEGRAPAPIAGQRSRRVLVAEDHPVNQRVIQGMVEKLGLEADIVSNGLEAVHAVCQTQYAAVLMDCQMPDMDGIEATRFIRGNEEGIGHIPIVAVTAFGHEEDRRRCLEAGVDEFMVKPIRMEVLAEVLKRLTQIELKPADSPDNAVPSQIAEIDAALARLRADLDADLVREVVGLFIEDTRNRIDEISHGIQQESREDVRNLAHKIRGSCGSLGARALMLECEQLESLALHAAWPQIVESTESVKRNYELIVPQLQAYLDSHAPSA